MELHRIVAPDASKATAEALRLYGPDALVISTRRLKNDRTEIIVATEAAEATEARTPRRRHRRGHDQPDNAQSQAPALETKGGKAFKATFEAQLSGPKPLLLKTFPYHPICRRSQGRVFTRGGGRRRPTLLQRTRV